jgi:hypothetical protein
MQKPDRYEITFRVHRDAEGKPVEPLYVCSLDDSIWMNEAEASRHTLKTHFDTFYQTERQPCDPPKGTWTLVGQFDEVILGPPNYHGYQEKLREIHNQRAPRLPFEVFKSKVRFVKDEAVVKQWIESQSSRLQYTALNVPEPKTLLTMSDVEAHFREVHAPNLIKSVDSWSLKRGENAPRLPEALNRVLRVSLERERKFPIKTMTALSGAFAHAGLQFYKRDKTVVHVSVARPRYLDLETISVSVGVRKIIDFINTTPSTTRKKMLEALSPTPAAAPVADVAQATPTDTSTATAPEAVAEGTAQAAPVETPAVVEAVVASTPSGPTLDQQALLTDLHWLIHQGHVIEFANGVLETAKKPMDRPTPPPQQPKAEARQPREPREPRKPRRGFGNSVADNIGLIPLPAVQPALIG